MTLWQVRQSRAQEVDRLTKTYGIDKYTSTERRTCIVLIMAKSETFNSKSTAMTSWKYLIKNDSAPTTSLHEHRFEDTTKALRSKNKTDMTHNIPVTLCITI